MSQTLHLNPQNKEVCLSDLKHEKNEEELNALIMLYTIEPDFPSNVTFLVYKTSNILVLGSNGD
jgi:hypothetical protein